MQVKKTLLTAWFLCSILLLSLSNLGNTTEVLFRQTQTVVETPGQILASVRSDNDLYYLIAAVDITRVYRFWKNQFIPIKGTENSRNILTLDYRTVLFETMVETGWIRAGSVVRRFPYSYGLRNKLLINRYLPHPNRVALTVLTVNRDTTIAQPELYLLPKREFDYPLPIKPVNPDNLSFVFDRSGENLYFEGLHQSKPAIFQFNINSRTCQRLTQTIRGFQHAVLSPCGTFILFTDCALGGNLYRWFIKTKILEKIVNGSYQYPAISPDSSHYTALLDRQSGYQLCMGDFSGQIVNLNKQTVGAAAQFPARNTVLIPAEIEEKSILLNYRQIFFKSKQNPFEGDYHKNLFRY